MKSKTSRRHHFTNYRTVKIKSHYQIGSHQNSHILLLVEMKNGKMSASYKVKHTLPLWSRNPNPSYLLERHENVYPQKYLYRNFQGSFIHTSQKCKQFKCSSTGDWIKYGTVIQWKTPYQLKGSNYRYTVQHRCCHSCLVAKSCPTLSNFMDCSLSGSSVHGISQERILEWVTISSSRGSSWPRDKTCISCTGKWALYHWATWEAPVQHWMMSENITLQERSLTQKSTKYMVIIIWKLRTSGHGTTDWFQIGKGVRQGCILLPCLFNLYAKYITRNAGLEEAQAGSRLPGEISITSDMQMTPLLWQKVKRN